MAQPRDPWNQNFLSFKTDYRNAGFTKTSLGIFTKSELQALMNVAGASHVVIYSAEHPMGSVPLERKMVAIAVDSLGNRLSTTTQQQYATAIHNCPPDCDITPFMDKVNLLKQDSTQ